MTRCLPLMLAVWVSVVCGPAVFAQESPRLPRIFIETASASDGALAVAEHLGASRDVSIGGRVEIATIDDLNGAPEQILAAFRQHQIPAWVAVHAPGSTAAVGPWQTALRALFARSGNDIFIFEVLFDHQPQTLRDFALQVAATEARAAARDIKVAIGGVDEAATYRTSQIDSKTSAPYVDLLALPQGVGLPDGYASALPGAHVVRRGGRVADADDARREITRTVLMTIGTSELAAAWSGTPEALTAGIRALTPVSDLIAHDVQPIDPAASELRLTHAGQDVTASVRHRLLFDEQTFATYLMYESARASSPLEVALHLAADGKPVVFDLFDGRRSELTRYKREEASSRAYAAVPLTGRPMVVNFSEGATEQYVDRTVVNAERQLSVEEIVARHRQHQARHDVLLQNYRAMAVMEQHFRPSLTDPGYDVVTENEYFVDDEGTEWEERSFSVNGSKWGADRPPFPLLQPEKVLSLPLELRLDQDYRYELDGLERIGDVECYRVRFEPTREDAALYRGTVWIDRTSFARRRVRAVQTRTSAPVISNEETHTYEPVTEVNGFPLLLLTKLAARQIVLIAGRNLLLEKSATFDNFRVNDSAFAQSRQEARRGTRVMYRDTERGVRYFVKEGEARVVSERATASARAMAMGVLVDPSFAFPLPIFGINYLDFEFRGRPDTQFALLFGGVLAAGNLQRPKLGGTNVDASVDFFGIAAPASDRLFVNGHEEKSEALLTWPLSTGLNLGWQYTAFQKAQLQYQVRYDPFVRDRTTDESFVVPSSTITQGVGGAWEYKRGGYSLGANGTYYVRADWEPWGAPDALAVDAPRTYVKYAVHVTRDFFVDAFQKVHVNVSYFGGDRLDRFSRYQFGLFDDTRIHGVPASGVRFDNLGMVRGSYSFNIFEQYRLDLFAEQAWGQDREVDRTWQPLTGLGFAVNLRAPWNTILRADVGKSLLPDRYTAAGSTVFQIMLLKPLGGRQ